METSNNQTLVITDIISTNSNNIITTIERENLLKYVEENSAWRIL